MAPPPWEVLGVIVRGASSRALLGSETVGNPIPESFHDPYGLYGGDGGQNQTKQKWAMSAGSAADFAVAIGWALGMGVGHAPTPIGGKLLMPSSSDESRARI